MDNAAPIPGRERIDASDAHQASERGIDPYRRTATEQQTTPEERSEARREKVEAQAEQQDVRKLEARDREVRTHEQAHVAAAGAYVSGPISYTYQRGPNGQNYAIGGHVNLDISPIPGDPAATREKAQVLLRAALAPAEPSSADHQIAARARQMMVQAQMEMARQGLNGAKASTNQAATESDLGAKDGEGTTAPTATTTAIARFGRGYIASAQDLAVRIVAMVGPFGGGFGRSPLGIHAIA